MDDTYGNEFSLPMSSIFLTYNQIPFLFLEMGLLVQETVSFLISNGNSLNFEDEIILEEENCNILKI